MPQDNYYKSIVTDLGCHIYFVYGLIALELVLPLFLMTETARQVREERSKCWIITRYGLPEYYVKMILMSVLSSVSYAFVQHLGILIFTTNAGKQLYEDSVQTDLSSTPRKVILNALKKDVDKNGSPYF